jgi:hypothetical protein
MMDGRNEKLNLKDAVGKLEKYNFDCEGAHLENTVEFIRLKMLAETWPDILLPEIL